VDLETALRGVTINTAKQLGIEGVTGTLEVGKKVDFMILEKNPRTVDAEILDKLVVQQTWLERKVIYDVERE